MLALLKTLNRIGFVNLSYFILYKFFYKLSLLNFFLNKSKYTYGEIFFNPTFHRIDVSDINKSSIINSADLILKNHLSFWLNWSDKILLNRIKYSEKRPLAFKAKDYELIDLIKKRSNIYSKALYEIKCDNQTKDQIVNKVLKIYETY